MYSFELSTRYRRAVKEKNLDLALSMFSPDAVIVSPLRGICDPKSYHEWLFSTVDYATLHVENVFQALSGDIGIAVQSRYKWVLKNGDVIEFRGVSIFEFTADREKIRKISNFYDTELVRPSILQP